MPGIIVIKQQNSALFQRNRNVIHEMADTILHEPFYKFQFLEVPQLGLHACKVYLDHEYSTKEISKNEDESIQCMLSGELYGFNEISSKLNYDKHTIRNKCDMAELIIHFYEEKGEKIFGYLNGCFNLLIVDTKNEKIIVSNDRFGLQRFYYSKLPGGDILFAPEVKCFKVFPDLDLTLDLKSVIQNFRYNAILGNNSFYQQIKRFPIATNFTFKNSQWEINEYWTPEEILNKPKLSLNSFLDKSIATFESIVENYYTPGSTGLSLTGGYDTRAILSVLDKKGIKLPCYTFGGMFKDSLDVKLSKKLADETGNSHNKILLGKDFLKDIEYWLHKAIYVSDGIAKFNTCHEYYVNLAAKEFGTIRLTGKYGSQIARGVSLLKDRSPFLGILNEDFRRKYINTPNELNELKKLGLATLIREELPQLEGTKQTQEMAVLIVRTPYMDNEFVDLMLRKPNMENVSLLQEHIILKNAPHLANIPINHFAHIPTNIGDFIKKGPIKNTIKTIYSIPCFFDSVYNWEKLPSLALPMYRLGDILKISPLFNGHEVWTHYRLWFMKELKEYILGVILDPVTIQRPWYDGNFLEQMIKYHYAGKKNFTSEINKIISFEIWSRQNNI